MREDLDFFFEQWVSEWDIEFSDLVLESENCDLRDHKDVVMQGLNQVKEMIETGDYPVEDKEHLLNKMAKVVAWIEEL